MSIEHYFPVSTNKPDICDLFKAAAIDTWERIKFSRTKPGLKIHETTITQNLIYEINLLKSDNPHWQLLIFESTDEKSNGNDLELQVLNNGRSYKYAIQAKIIYHDLKKRDFSNGTYPMMKHGVSGQNQIDLLIKYAATEGYIPLYLMYNYISGTNCKKNLGCSVTSAYFLKNFHTDSTGKLKRNISFRQLHRPYWNLLLTRYQLFYTFPWEFLVCDFRDRDEAFLKKLLEIPGNHQLTSKSLKDLRNDPNWEEVTSFYTKNGEKEESRKYGVNKSEINLHKDIENSLRKGEQELLFRPKFRIVIGE